MPSILISEPAVEVRELLVRIAGTIGYEAIVAEPERTEQPDADAVLIEPGDVRALDLARRMRAARPELPVICLSIYPPSLETDLLGPTAYLIKPFSVAELQRVLTAAVSGNGAGATSAPLSHHTQ
ncbi:MAG: hypothetical protein ACRDN6_00405 [Gaiellaceae bacterium]